MASQIAALGGPAATAAAGAAARPALEAGINRAALAPSVSRSPAVIPPLLLPRQPRALRTDSASHPVGPQRRAGRVDSTAATTSGQRPALSGSWLAGDGLDAKASTWATVADGRRRRRGSAYTACSDTASNPLRDVPASAAMLSAPSGGASPSVSASATAAAAASLPADVAQPSVAAAPAFPERLPEDFALPPGVAGAVTDLTRLSAEEALQVDPASSTLGYLRRILTSRVYDVAIESPLTKATRLSAVYGCDIFLKREDLQQVFSFKLRGAYNKMALMTSAQRAKGVICSSAGNHAQGVALAARELGCDAVIAMPVTTPMIKVNNVKRLGATVVLVGDTYDETQAYAQARAAEEGRVFVPPFDDPDVIAGQGTVGMEILQQLSGPLHAIFVPVGGGGLIAGIAVYVKALRPEVKVIGVEPVDANAMAQSLAAGERIRLSRVGGFADGVAVKMVGEETFRVCRDVVDGVVLVGTDEICGAIQDVFEETRCILEPAGALSLAGAKAYLQAQGLKDETVVAITSGANMNFDRLRLVADLARVGQKQEGLLTTKIPEVPGTFLRFVRALGDVNITEFRYSFNANPGPDGLAHVLYSLSVGSKEQLEEIVRRLVAEGMPTVDLSNNQVAKVHLRHMVGGYVPSENETLWRIAFPERPGALLRFLSAVSPRWNISLFHYRNAGEGEGNVLVGLHMTDAEKVDFHTAMAGLGYAYTEETSNEAIRMVLSRT